MISGRNNRKTDVKSSYYFTFGNTWGWANGEERRFNDVKLKNWNNKKLKKIFIKT